MRQHSESFESLGELEESWARVAMLLAGHSQSTVRRCLGHTGSAREWWRNGGSPAGALGSSSLWKQLDEERNRCLALNIRVLSPQCPGWPTTLNQLSDPPVALWSRGVPLLELEGTRLGLVGARRVTSYGREVTASFAQRWGELGGVVVSGGARGVDAVAHKAALDGGGSTVVVMGTGMAKPYPRENGALFDEVLERGSWVSERPTMSPVHPQLFPLRNRLIAALSQGILVTQAGKQSGALHTVRYALKLGRAVFSVPAPLGEAPFEGSNELLASGIPAILDPDSLWRGISTGGHLGRKPPKSLPFRRHARPTVQYSELDKSSRICLDLIAQGRGHVDDLAGAFNGTMAELSLLLLDLELRGW